MFRSVDREFNVTGFVYIVVREFGITGFVYIVVRGVIDKIELEVDRELNIDGESNIDCDEAH